MSGPTFTKEQLARVAAIAPSIAGSLTVDLAASHLALMEERDQARRELEEADGTLLWLASKIDRSRAASFGKNDIRRTVIFFCDNDGRWDHVPACQPAIPRARERAKGER